MKEVKDLHTGQTWIELDKDEIKFGFLAECVEAMADACGCDYTDMFRRLEATDIAVGYILRHYESLHTQDWEYIVKDLVELLHEREALN